MSSLLDPTLAKAYELDKRWLEETAVPIVTVSGTFREDAKDFHDLAANNRTPDIILSRAHFSMALGAAIEAWGTNNDQGKKVRMDRQKAWMVDPTNYVSPTQWANVKITEGIGEALARHRILKILKDIVDNFGRQKIPILNSITPPLLYLTEHIDKPILCFHIAAGNILLAQGHKVMQVITDPHVRPEYVMNAGQPGSRYCVFEERTKLEFLEMAAIHHIKVHPDQIIVTGPPVDPRVVAARKNKVAWRNGTLKLCITTGGLGTNKYEIRQILHQMLPELHRSPKPYQILVYAGTQKDIADMVIGLAKDEHLQIDKLENQKAVLRLIYHPQILNANEMLIKYGFPWADGFISKPSGDMAYDAVAAGCFLLTLQEWGVWEERIREIFEQKEISRRADTEHILEQLGVLLNPQAGSLNMSWVEKAMNHAFGIEKLFLQGDQKILRAFEEFSKI